MIIAPGDDIFFRKIVSADFELLKKWQKEPHVVEFWGDSDKWEQPYEEYVYETNNGSVEQFVIQFKQRPIGYFQYYWAARVGDGWWQDSDENTVGLDLYIGDSSLIGQGFGRLILEAAIKMLKARDGVKTIIADPCPENRRMIHILATLGFKDCGVCQTPDGPAVLMTYEIVEA